MLNRSIKFISVAFLLLSATLSFIVVRELDEVIPDEEAAIIWVREIDGTVSREDTIRSINQFSQERQVNVALEAPDLKNPGGLRHLYLASGDPSHSSSSWIEEGYPDFSHSFRTKVHPFTEFEGLDLRGYYYVFGDQNEALSFRDTLADSGLHGDVASQDEVVTWVKIIQGRTLFAALVGAVLCGIVAAGSGVLLNARSYAVLRLQGISFGRILLRDLRQMVSFMLTSASVAIVGVVIIFYFYNGLARFSLLLTIASFYLAILIAFSFFAHGVTLAFLHRTDILPSLKGKIPSRMAILAAYCVRIPALALVLSFTSGLVLSFQNLQEQHVGQERFSEVEEFSRIHLTGSASELQESGTEEEVGEWLRDADANGDLLISFPEEGLSILPRGTAERPEFQLLVVNETYLEETSVLDPDGNPYSPHQADNEVRILAPESLITHEPDIREGARSWIFDFQGRDNPDLDADISFLPMKDSQSIFTYGAVGIGPMGTSPFLQNPVMLVLPNGSDILHPRSYFSYATTGAAIFPDPSVIENSSADAAIFHYVNSVQPIAQQAADTYRDLAAQMRLETFNLAAGTLVLFVTGITVCIVHTRKEAQRIFARHISGWTFLATHRSIITIELLLAIAFTGWATVRSLETLATIRDPMSAPSMNTTAEVVAVEPAIAASISVLGFALVVSALVFFHRKIVREGASES
jgi:hypothetical protein